jgi:hypothetical protein
LILKGEGLADAEIRGEFSDDEHAVLTAYLQQYDELVQSKPMQLGFPCHFEVRVANGEMYVTSQLPSSDDLAILLHRLRPFILDEEPASFNRVSGILGKHNPHPHVRHLLGEQRRLYDGRDMQQQITIRLNDIVVNSERVLRDWLNSSEYHRDPDKRRAVENLLQGMPNDLFRGILVSLLVDKLKAIQSVASLVALMLGKIQELDFTSRKSLTGAIPPLDSPPPSNQ